MFFLFVFLKKQVDRIEKKKASGSFSRKASSYRINMQLIEGQVCVFFLFYKKTDKIELE